MMSTGNQCQFELSSEEQATTAAYKLVCNENEYLKKSLKKTQNKLEKMRGEKHEKDKQNAILTHKQKNVFWIEFFKFISSVAIGSSVAYLLSPNPNFLVGGLVCICSLIIFIVTIIFSNK